ncbi:kinase-like domain-containing protein, partial [Ochromonadaceae sp. CCMP2298]
QSLNHPNVVDLIEVFEEPGHFYVVLERIRGGELFERIIQRAFYSEKEARDVAVPLLRGVKYIHDAHIAHRDLKPENLLMTSQAADADIKIVDFGFACRTEGFDISDQCGTPAYMAPEILLNKLHGRPVDMW